MFGSGTIRNFSQYRAFDVTISVLVFFSNEKLYAKCL